MVTEKIITVDLTVESRLDDADPCARVTLYITDTDGPAGREASHWLTLDQAQDISERLQEAVKRGRRMVAAGGRERP